MRIGFVHWKYIFRNLWFVLPFSVVPAAFLALTVNYEAVELVARSFFAAELDLTFPQLFRAFSLIRIDFPGVLLSVFALVAVVLFTVFLLAFVEKHMRIGKRTLSGVFSQLGSQVWTVLGITIFFAALYEVWALLLAAVLFAVSAIKAKVAACVLFALVLFLFVATLLYLVSLFYLWLPCMQITSFRAYDALLYSYRLAAGVRFRLIVAMLVSYLVIFFSLVGSAYLPTPASVILMAVVFVFAYMSFCVRMETVYFETDKLDREDLLRSYKEL